jgi:hypothetical protein
MAMKKPTKLSDGTAWEKLELFPTPPWATRALFECVLPRIFSTIGASRIDSCWEPAAGLGHMAETITEYCYETIVSDVADYPLEDGSRMSDHGLQVIDFLGAPPPMPADWIITNPPFKQTEGFLQRALKQASRGVALLQKQTWLTGGERFAEVYLETPPDLVAQFVERVPMCLGGYDPRGSTATDYAWFIWLQPEGLAEAGRDWAERRQNAPKGWLQLLLIPPGRRDAYIRARDLQLAETRRLPGWHPDPKVRKLRRRIHAERDARMRGEGA